MKLVNIGDEVSFLLTASVDEKIITESSIHKLIIGEPTNLKGLNSFFNAFINNPYSDLENIKDYELILNPEEAYGVLDKNKIGALPKSFNNNLKIGDSVEISLNDGSKLNGLVKSENKDTYIVDCNHPYVDKKIKLLFSIKGIEEKNPTE